MTRFSIILAVVLSCATYRAGAGALDNLPDPTRPASFRGTSASGDRSGLQTTVVSPSRSFAIINGRTFSVGDKVGDAVIVEIRPYEVTLRSKAGTTKTIRMMPPLTRTITKTAATESTSEQ